MLLPESLAGAHAAKPRDDKPGKERVAKLGCGHSAFGDRLNPLGDTQHPVELVNLVVLVIDSLLAQAVLGDGHNRIFPEKFAFSASPGIERADLRAESAPISSRKIFSIHRNTEQIVT